MIKAFPLLVVLSSLASLAPAQTLEFDGAWAEKLSSCIVTNADFLPMRISGATIQFYESRCELTNPVNIRDMAGQLFDFTCNGEGETWTTRGLLLLNTDGTLTYNSNGHTAILQRCALP